MKKIILSIFAIILLIPIFMLAPVSASSTSSGVSNPSSLSGSSAANSACAGISQLGGTQTCGSSATGGSSTISKIIKEVVNLLSLVLGAIAIVMIVVSGIRFALSGGEASKVSSAKNTIIYAVVGLVIAALAQAILHWVVGTSSSLSTGTIFYFPVLY